MRIGQGALRGGMITRTPLWRQPRIAPPRASTMKLTKNLEKQTIMMLATNVQGAREFLADNNNKQKMNVLLLKKKTNKQIIRKDAKNKPS